MGTQQYTRSQLRSWWPPRPPWITLAVVALLMRVHLTHSSISCGPFIKSAGGTVPMGDIVLEYGSGVPLEITCILDPDNEIVQSLYKDQDEPGHWPSNRIIFTKNAERVAMKYVSVINETAAHLHIANPPAGLNTYSCALLLDAHPQRHNNHSHRDTVNVAQLSAAMPTDLPSPLSTVQPTSLETSGPPPLMSKDSQVGVCLNTVAVGYKPFSITNFTCISDNWSSLTCNWTKPHNPIKTNYKLFFKLLGRPGGRTITNCPTDSDTNNNTCYWDLSTTPLYRQAHEYYYFTITGENSLGNSITHFRFHHYANVIPASPINITVVDKTQSSAMLRWSVGIMTAFPRALIHKIEYKSQWDSNPEHWHSVNVTEICNSSLASNQSTLYPNFNCRERDTGYYFFNVTDLKYAFTHYDFRIYVRSSASRGEDKWSAPGCITLKTKPTIPRRPPRTDIGSFECVTSSIDKSLRDILIYWQNIDDNEKCGDAFEYHAYYTSITADNITIIHRSNETYKNYAKFYGLSTNVAYNFTVYSANKEGLSEEYSTVYVPNERDKPDEPLSFTKMAFDERGVFELSWKNASSQKLSNGNQINDYTIFWCENDKDRPYQCNGYMNWKHIPSSESCYNVTVMDHMKIYQFAISANSKGLPKNDFHSLYQPTTSSSGMVWASCTVLHNKIVGKIKNVWVNMIGSTSMELRWKLDCSDRIGAVLGFRIFYCPVVSINNSACKESMLNKTVSGDMVQESRGIAFISNLKSYTTYMVTIALITKHGEGLHSDPLLNTTLEGAPDIKDLKINVTDLTNTTVTIQWLPPTSTNGVVRFYKVHYYLDDTQMQQQQEIIDSIDDQQSVNERFVMVHETKCRLDHLESYRRYNITVTACTTLCSNRSIPVQVQTAVGLPGVITQPNLSYENTTRIVVSWPRPVKPAGPIDYYQLVVVHYIGPTNSQITNDVGSYLPTALASTQQIQENPNNFMYHSESNVFRVPVPDCNSEHGKGQQTFSFAVRAVNNNPLDPYRPYYGPWSAPGSVSCVLPGLPLALHLVIWSCLFIVLTTVSTYWGNRFWRKYKVMHNVQVVLPPTLNINFKFDHYNNFGEDVMDTSQTFYVEDGHIVYEGAPAEGGVVYNNGNSSSGGSTSSDRLPLARWSPTTATTTITTGDDDDSSSSKQHLILPQVVPTMKSENFSDGNSVKSTEDPVPPIEPVLPFFTLPDMPSITIKPLSVNHGLHGGTITLNRPEGMRHDRNSVITHGHGKVNGYQGCGIVRNTGYQDSSIIRNNGIQDGCIGRNTNTGYQGSGIGRNTGYQDSGICRNAGYQDSGICRNIGYQDGGINRNPGYQDGNIVVVVNSIYNDFEKKKNKNETDCAFGIPTAAVTIDCFIGDQPKLFDRCGENLSSPNKEKLPAESPSSVCIEKHDQQEDEPSSCQHVDDDQQQQPQPLQLEPQQEVQPQSQPQPQQPQSQNDGYCGKQMLLATAGATNDLDTKSNEEPQQQQQQQQPQEQQQQQLQVTDIPVSATAYVMLDMVTAQKRLLDNIGRLEFTKSTVVQPDTVPVDVDVVVGCDGDGAAAAAQCESNVEVTTT